MEPPESRGVQDGGCLCAAVAQASQAPCEEVHSATKCAGRICGQVISLGFKSVIRGRAPLPSRRAMFWSRLVLDSVAGKGRAGGRLGAARQVGLREGQHGRERCVGEPVSALAGSEGSRMSDLDGAVLGGERPGWFCVRNAHALQESRLIQARLRIVREGGREAWPGG